jgi:hypothetical protein
MMMMMQVDGGRQRKVEQLSAYTCGLYVCTKPAFLYHFFASLPRATSRLINNNDNNNNNIVWCLLSTDHVYLGVGSRATPTDASGIVLQSR